jgi:isocitrate/isopropylmalate dehydrogenase
MKHRIAVIAGDGIGKEVMPEGVRVLDVAMPAASASSSSSTPSTSPAATTTWPRRDDAGRLESAASGL